MNAPEKAPERAPVFDPVAVAAELEREFGTRQPALELVCSRYFGMQEKQARLLAARHELPVPVFRLHGHKSEPLVRVEDLADLVVRRYADARKVWDGTRSWWPTNGAGERGR